MVGSPTTLKATLGALPRLCVQLGECSLGNIDVRDQRLDLGMSVVGT
jgi:hypothetical protein